MDRPLFLAGFLGVTGVAAGAFGAHALGASVTPGAPRGMGDGRAVSSDSCGRAVGAGDAHNWGGCSGALGSCGVYPGRAVVLIFPLRAGAHRCLAICDGHAGGRLAVNAELVGNQLARAVA